MKNGALLPLLIYFLFGALGTFCRVWLSPVLEATSANRRLVVEVIIGGLTGMLLPYLGTALSAGVGLDVTSLFSGVAPAVQVVLKGALIALLSYSGSLTIGEILARRAAPSK